MSRTCRPYLMGVVYTNVYEPCHLHFTDTLKPIHFCESICLEFGHLSCELQFQV